MDLFRIIPRFEIKSLNLVKGINMEGFRKISNFENRIEKYVKMGADELFFDDIVASLYNRLPNFDLLKRLVENVNIPVIASGGISNLKIVNKYMHSGADKIAINSSLFKNKNLIKNVVRNYGSQAIIAQIQYKFQGFNKWEVYFWNGRERSYIEVKDWIKYLQDNGIGEIIFVSIDRDGRSIGPDLEFINSVKDLVYTPFIYGGGIRDLDDINMLKKIGIDGCTLSNSLHFDKLVKLKK